MTHMPLTKACDIDKDCHLPSNLIKMTRMDLCVDRPVFVGY